MKRFSLSNITEKIRGGDRPPFEKYYATLFILFVAYLSADLITLTVRQYLLPTTIPPKKMAPVESSNARNYSFTDVLGNNIFNSDRKIPPSLSEIEGGGGGEEGAPRLSQLPLDLIGTIVHADPSRSLATVLLRGQTKVEPYSVGQKIESMAEVKEIKRERLIFRNLSTQALEYIEIPQDAKITLSTERPFTAGKTIGVDDGEEKTNFTLKRDEVDKELENLPKLLQAARVVPEMTADGRVKGFRMVEIQAGSIYEKLGLHLGDVLKGANGEEVTNAQKAMETFQALKGSDEINLVIERNGVEMNLKYTLTR